MPGIAATSTAGLKGLRRFWNEWQAVWTLTIEVSEFRERGDTVIALARVSARGQTLSEASRLRE
jgi:hypothetical protein